MLLDQELYLTPVAGQLFDPTTGLTEYGSVPLDLMSVGINVMKGEPIDVFGIVKTADVNNITSYAIDIVIDDDGAGTNEVSALKGGAITKALAALQVEDGVFKIGTLDPSITIGAANRYLTAKVTQTGSDPTTGLLAIFLQKGVHDTPQNDALIV